MILNGKKISEIRNQNLANNIETVSYQFGRKPGLSIILVGNDEASEIYVNSKIKKAQKAGINAVLHHFDENATQRQIETEIIKLNVEPEVDGIVVQLPLPEHFDENAVLDLVSPLKDVDGFHVINQGMLFQKRDAVRAATPQGIMNLLKAYDIDVSGMDAVVVGRSKIVGMPIAKMLLDKNATVTICHSRTKNLKEHTKNADLIIMATGKPNLLTEDMVKKGAIVVDVGINRVDGKLKGDADFENLKDKCSFITPVPGGVGPMTINALFENLYVLYYQRALKAQNDE